MSPWLALVLAFVLGFMAGLLFAALHDVDRRRSECAPRRGRGGA